MNDTEVAQEKASTSNLEQERDREGHIARVAKRTHTQVAHTVLGAQPVWITLAMMKNQEMSGARSFAGAENTQSASTRTR